MTVFKCGDSVILTPEAQRSFPALVSKGSHVGEVVRVVSSKRIRIKRHGAKNADYWGAGLWKHAVPPEERLLDIIEAQLANKSDEEIERICASVVKLMRERGYPPDRSAPNE